MGKPAPFGSGDRFKALKKRAAAKGDVDDPDAADAAKGSKKPGKKKFEKFAAKGEKKPAKS